MSTLLPPIGRNGIVNSVRKISGHIVPGWRDVDPTAEFIAGYAAVLNSSGQATVADATSTGKIIGLFFCHKTTSFYRPVRAEAVTFTGTTSTINLAHANLKVDNSASVRVTSTAPGGTVFNINSAFSINTTNGTITNMNSGIGGTDTVYVSYLYIDPNLAGLDQTLGSGKAAIIESNGEIGTLVYETNAAWAINSAVKVSANGLPTVGGSGPTIGFITKVPTSSNPELIFQMRLS